ncbi:hypothetical protein CAI16_20005 [Virgibacillus dokdonensis]|uniref:Endospore appendages core domain-containing protein n=1 Tax=Virgibacillus dokdonensis TaxID=302167 RepID=A0A3E0WFN4_9BACI|nr:S-Ena type endospore appendage [Virgibacillus dokdonensis]RFA31754.1 hypothetical protein CAI16_20005 [Virgibacillus dokdonensis]
MNNSLYTCLGSGGATNTSTELIPINLCQPIRTTCDPSSIYPLFFAGSLPTINGIFTVTNSSSVCDMVVEVTDENGVLSYNVPPLSSVSVNVEGVTLIQINCIGATGFCTGSFEANFYSCVSC